MIMLKKEKGVSTVVGSILMLVLGVVLVSVLSLYMTGFFSNLTSGQANVSPLNANVLTNAQQKQITFLISSGQVSSPFFIYLNSPAGKNIIYTSGVSLNQPRVTIYGTNVVILVEDVNGDGMLDAGDTIVLTYSGSSLSDLQGYVFEIVYNGAVEFSYVI